MTKTPRLGLVAAAALWAVQTLPLSAATIVRSQVQAPVSPAPAGLFAGILSGPVITPGYFNTLPQLWNSPVPEAALSAEGITARSQDGGPMALPVPAALPAPAVSPAAVLKALPQTGRSAAPRASLLSAAAALSDRSFPGGPSAGGAVLRSRSSVLFDGSRGIGSDLPGEPVPAGKKPAADRGVSLSGERKKGLASKDGGPLAAAALRVLDEDSSPGSALYPLDVEEMAAKARLTPRKFTDGLVARGRLVRLTDGTLLDVKFAPAARQAELADAVGLLNAPDAAGHVRAAALLGKLSLGPSPDRMVLALALNATLRVFDDILGAPGAAAAPGLQEALQWVRHNHYSVGGRVPDMPEDVRDDLRDLLDSGKVSSSYAPALAILRSTLGENDAPPAKPSPKLLPAPAGYQPASVPAAKPKSGDPVSAMRERISDSGMPGEIREKALAELDRYSRYRQGDPEGQKIEVYLDWLASLPWTQRTADETDLSRARTILDDRHSGLADVKERILEFLAVRKKTGSKKGAIICFTGPPGVGKTSIASGIAEAMGRRFVRLSLGGVNDETELRGHGRTYLGSQPGGIIRKMKEAGTVNPVVLLDEVDKLGRDGNKGDPTAALLEILDPAQNDTFRDRYLDIPYDLSEVLFIVTSNELNRIPAPLRDRMEVIEFSGYTVPEKVAIAQKHIVEEMRRKNGLSPEEAGLTDGAVRAVIEGHTREAGVRTLREKIATLMRRIAAWMETRGLAAPGLMDEEAVEKYLGVPRFGAREAAPNDVGVATALAVNDLGGSAFNVETVAYPGTGQLRLRRQMLEMIDDSAHNVYAYLRTAADKLGIAPEKFRTLDIEIAFTPAGPIDGPSAGITMATAMASRLSGRKVKDGIAMTGEITLTGRVLPIGGLKQKVMAAHRAGYRTVIFPEANLRDADSIPEEVRREMRLVPVRHVDQVFAEALEPASAV
ncbi:MAG TPA: endopeptidase La [Elusimicrobia bacterium]|nr:endopeptidase La [Elusimicrobiota bacterium]